MSNIRVVCNGYETGMAFQGNEIRARKVCATEVITEITPEITSSVCGFEAYLKTESLKITLLILAFSTRFQALLEMITKYVLVITK